MNPNIGRGARKQSQKHELQGGYIRRVFIVCEEQGEKRRKPRMTPRFLDETELTMLSLPVRGTGQIGLEGNNESSCGN